MSNKIMKVKKNHDGDITDVMLDNNQTLSIQEAITMAQNHQIEGVNVGKARNGREFLRSNPDDNEDNNLDRLPEFE